MMMWKKETSERGRGGRVLFFFFFDWDLCEGCKRSHI